MMPSPSRTISNPPWTSAQKSHVERLSIAHTRPAPSTSRRPPSRPPTGRGRTVADTAQVVTFVPDHDSSCAHLSLARPVVPRTPGCEQCLREGQTWVHLRLCVTCGHVGCCESSPGRHASAHANADDAHALICSLEPGENWGWCYLDSTTLEPAQRTSGQDRAVAR